MPSAACKRCGIESPACHEANFECVFVGNMVPATCDDPASDLDNQCASTFVAYWSRCKSKLQSGLPLSAFAQLSGFNTKCEATMANDTPAVGAEFDSAPWSAPDQLRAVSLACFAICQSLPSTPSLCHCLVWVPIRFTVVHSAANVASRCHHRYPNVLLT